MKERNVVLILAMVFAMTCVVQAQDPTRLPGDNGGADYVETLVPGGVYLDFLAEGIIYTNADGTTKVSTTGTVVSIVEGWNFPDNSDNESFVDGDPVGVGDGTGDCYDSKSGNGHGVSAEFVATVTGLDFAATYAVYLKAFASGGGYGYAWGLASAQENQWAPVRGADGVQVVIFDTNVADPNAKGAYLWLLRPEFFAPNGAGEIALHFDNVIGLPAAYRAQYDGLLLVDATINPPPAVDAGPDQGVYSEGLPTQLDGLATDVGPLDGVSPGSPGGVVDAYWFQASGPVGGVATFDPVDTTLVYDPTVTFNIPGVYELVLQASDIADADANDIVVITFKDHADDFLLGHWEMENDLLDETASANHGEGWGRPSATDANTVPMPAVYSTDSAIGTYSLFLNNESNGEPNYYVYLGNGDDANELNMFDVPPTFSAVAWIKTTSNGEQVIINKGGDGDLGIRWQLLTAGGKLMLLLDGRIPSGVEDDPETPEIDESFTEVKLDGASSTSVDDGLWHHVIATCDGQMVRLYVDGVYDNDDSVPEVYDIPAGFDISGSAEQGSGYIGDSIYNGDNDPNQVRTDRAFYGFVDDVRVYNYDLPLDDPTYDSILGLAAMGPIVASVDAGVDFEVYWEAAAPPTQLNGTITDNGVSPVTSGMWTSNDPGGGEASFTIPTDPNSKVTFPAGGTYELTLTATDTDAITDENLGGIVSDTVVVTATPPTCADVKADGLLLALDLDEDCEIGLGDLAMMLEDYLVCNDPVDPSCVWAWPL